jgi:hypothetical protein
MITTVRDEIQRLELAVTGRIPEVDHFYALGLDEPDDVIRGELVSRLPEKLHKLIAAHKYVIVHSLLLINDGQI